MQGGKRLHSMASFKFYFADTVFVDGKTLPTSLCKALNELRDTFTRGVEMSARFDPEKDMTTSIRYNIWMTALTADPLQDRMQRMLDALRVLFRFKAEEWSKVAEKEDKGNGCYRTRLFMFPEQNLSIRINVKY